MTVNNDINNNNATMSPLPLDPEPIRGPDHPPLEPVATSQTEDLNNGPEVCDPSDHEEGSVLEEKVIDEPPTHSSPSDPSDAREQKKSYASMVKVSKVAKASALVYVPTSNTRVVPANADLQSLGSAKPSPELEVSAPTGDSALSTDAHEEGGSRINMVEKIVEAIESQKEAYLINCGLKCIT